MARYFAILILSLLISLSFSSVYGAVTSASTDKLLYHNGDSIIIFGNVDYDSEIPSIIIQIVTPSGGGLAHIAAVVPPTSGSFTSLPIHAGGPTWSENGIYTIKISYGGIFEIPFEYEYSSSSEESTSESTSKSTSKSTSESTSESTPEPTLVPESTFTTLKSQIPNFPSFDKSPQYYIDRYNDESSYKSWFDSQFPFNSLIDVVGYKLTSLDGFPSLDKSPQSYIDRYNNDPDYKSWFDSQFSDTSIYNILGYEDPIPLPPELKFDAELWATGKITDSEFVTGIEFMLENNIIMISNIPSGDVSGDEIPDWVRNNALWWSQDLISENEFVNSLEFLIQEGIIIIN